MVFDVSHDFEGPRAPKAHLDTVLDKPVTPPGHPPYVFYDELLAGGSLSCFENAYLLLYTAFAFERFFFSETLD